MKNDRKKQFKKNNLPKNGFEASLGRLFRLEKIVCIKKI